MALPDSSLVNFYYSEFVICAYPGRIIISRSDTFGRPQTSKGSIVIDQKFINAIPLLYTSVIKSMSAIKKKETFKEEQFFYDLVVKTKNKAVLLHK